MNKFSKEIIEDKMELWYYVINVNFSVFLGSISGLIAKYFNWQIDSLNITTIIFWGVLIIILMIFNNISYKIICNYR
mgnify:CR=1 FL=1